MYTYIYLVITFLRGFPHQNSYAFPSHMWYSSCLSHCPWFNRLNIRYRAHHYAIFSKMCYFISLGFKHYTQYPQSMFFPSWATTPSPNGRSQWPWGLRHEMSSPIRTLGSCVRIPLKAWMSVFILRLYWVAALGRADPPSMESYRLS
jgi:hypothetical protein